MGFAENLKHIRKENKLSQHQLAAKLELAQSTIGMWEAGRRTPNLEEIRRISLALNITIDRLVSEYDSKIEITKDEIFVDGKKVADLDGNAISSILEHINALKSVKENTSHSDKQKIINKAKKILIIDDSKEMCDMLYSFLVTHSYKVFISFNGQMGLEYFQEIKPDLVFLDLTMPDIDGLDVLKIIREISDVPVLIITGHPEEVVDIHLADLRINGYIEKPFSISHILNTVKHVLGD